MDKLPEKDDVPDLRVFTVYHDDRQIWKFGLEETVVNKLFAVHRPIEGENINHLHPIFAETVAMYWVWKNDVKSKWVGFQHYHDSRFQCLDKIAGELDDDGTCFVDDYCNIPVKKQYNDSFGNNTWTFMMDALSERFGMDNEYSRYFSQRHNFYQRCSFAMKWDKFDKLCDEMFYITDYVCGKMGFGLDLNKYFELIDKGNIEKGTPFVKLQQRSIGHLCERFISAFIHVNFDRMLQVVCK